jgi:hypothetical protein
MHRWEDIVIHFKKDVILLNEFFLARLGMLGCFEDGDLF